MAMSDDRTLEPTRTRGIYRRHAGTCKRHGRCTCPYVVRWKDRDRSSRKQLFPTFDQARDFKATLGASSGPRRPLSSQTVDEYREAWLKGYRGRTARGLEESTRREYEISLRLHVAPLPIAQLRMRDVGAPDVRDWLGELERGGRSPTTIRKAKAALSVMFACAVEDGDLSSNPAAGVRYVPNEQAKRDHPKRKRRQLTAADVAAILDVMDEQWRAFFMLLVQSGVRVGELLGLTWRNVHLGDDPHLTIEEQVYGGQRKRLKTDASRGRVPLSPAMAAWLTTLRGDAAADSPVFPSTTGTPLNYHNVYSRILRPALRASGIALKVGETHGGEDAWDYQGVAFHAFRKACGSLLLAQGKNIKQVQGWLRHAQLTTTLNVYIHDVDDGLGSAAIWDEILPAGATVGPPASDSGCSDDGSEEDQKVPVSSQIAISRNAPQG
jgi:integrase